MEIQYIQGVVPMKKKINYDNCMKRKCSECKYYDECFGYKLKEENSNVRRKSNKRF